MIVPRREEATLFFERSSSNEFLRPQLYGLESVDTVIAARLIGNTWHPTDGTEQAMLKARAEAAHMALLDEGTTTCCYARSEKHWVTDPQGISWEHFHTLGSIPVFHEAPAAAATAEPAACCTPAAPRGKPLAIPVKAAGSCC